MKKTIYLQLLTIILCVAIITACNKEKITMSATDLPAQSMRSASLDFKEGILEGNVIPGQVKAIIMLYNGAMELGPFHLNRDGSFRIGNLAPGTYKFVLHWYQSGTTSVNNDQYNMTRSLEIEIKPGIVNTMDPIFL